MTPYSVRDTTRREFLRSAGVAGMLTAGVATLSSSQFGFAKEELKGDPQASDGLLAGIERSIIFPGRTTGVTWFSPRGTVVPGAEGPIAFYIMQQITGSDYFGPPHWTTSRDGGHTWTTPEAIPGLGRRKVNDTGLEEGVCIDTVPEYHPPTGTVLCMGHNVFYREGRLVSPQPFRHVVYIVRRPDGTWTVPQQLKWDNSELDTIYSCNCSQRVTLPDGCVVVPLTYGIKDRADRAVTSVRCSFDGAVLKIKDVGNSLYNRAGRGLLEPSLTAFRGRYYLTIRAEDGRGYVSVSDDGLTWQAQQAWAWDDGQPLEMSTTQQHWLAHSQRLYLVYTRKSADNAAVIRWRAPLWMAEVDPATLRLVRASERIVLPLRGDAGNQPQHVGLMGNFHTWPVGPEESWITVGEMRPRDGYKGDTLLARIRWSRPNELANVLRG